MTDFEVSQQVQHFMAELVCGQWIRDDDNVIAENMRQRAKHIWEKVSNQTRNRLSELHVKSELDSPVITAIQFKEVNLDSFAGDE